MKILKRWEIIFLFLLISRIVLYVKSERDERQNGRWPCGKFQHSPKLGNIFKYIWCVSMFDILILTYKWGLQQAITGQWQHVTLKIIQKHEKIFLNNRIKIICNISERCCSIIFLRKSNDDGRNIILTNKVLIVTRVSAAPFLTDMAFRFLFAPPLSFSNLCIS